MFVYYLFFFVTIIIVTELFATRNAQTVIKVTKIEMEQSLDICYNFSILLLCFIFDYKINK